MIRILALLSALTISTGLEALADQGAVIAQRSIMAKTVIGPGDIGISSVIAPGAVTDPEDAIGMETRITLYPGRPIMPGHLREPAVIERNDLVRLSYSAGALWIVTEARALGRGAPGEKVQVMNLDSRAVVTGVIEGPGEVSVRK